MEIWNGIESYPAESGPVVASIGNYDGVHLGHRAILDRVAARARNRGVPSMLISFDPHPLAVVAPQRLPRMLQTRRQKLRCVERLGLAQMLFIHFTADLSALSGEEFLERHVGPRIAFDSIFVGDSFRFGRGRGGDAELLRRIGERRGFEVFTVPPVHSGDEIVSSTAIRRAVETGDVEKAQRMLGQPFQIGGEVVRGDGRGRKIDCPTANVETDNEILPERGVYITETLALAGRFPSVTNIGVRPTFGGETLTVETHLLDFDEDLYGERVDLRFLARLRDEMRFRNLAELGDQIARDRAAAESYFQNQPIGSR